jgi:hypothetical protein
MSWRARRADEGETIRKKKRKGKKVTKPERQKEEREESCRCLAALYLMPASVHLRPAD